jgi:steroid 5-alpha reductase family enzyme
MSEWWTPEKFDFDAWLLSLAAIMSFALAGWVVSLLRRDVSIVDSMWSLMFLLALGVYLATSGAAGWRASLVLALVAIWALRLFGYITWRNHGQGEDHRYRSIRRNNEPHFRFKSLYIVFGLQGFLAWVICLPLSAAVSGQTGPGPLDYAAVSLWLVGMFFETVGDAQLNRFKSCAQNEGAVLDTGLWRFTRHPNYFGEFLIWWAYYLLALSAGGGWTICSPLLMSFLLLRVSGVALLERDIAERRPAYREYKERTNAFFPGRPRLQIKKTQGRAI